MQAALKLQLLDAASQPYQIAGNFQYRMARGKLGGDPLFAYLLEHSVLNQSARVLDLGCGRGLLAAWFLAAEKLAASAHWQPGIAVPTGITFHGVDLNAGACAIGNHALAPLYAQQLALTSGDMCQASLDGYDTITLLDVLHYIPFEQQDALLDRITAALPPGGLLLLRVGNADGGWRFKFSQWVDLAVARAHGYRLSRLYCRPCADWVQTLQKRGLAVTAQAMSEGTQFANVLLSTRASSPNSVK
jgi:cyclopropane fatty-acyl-phospholipid synthase-like methyltransferase